MDEKLFRRLQDIAGEEHVLRQEPMSRHTTFRIGGPAEIYVMPSAAEQVPELIRACRDADSAWFILGNGSNLLVSDAGYPGVVIQLDRNLQNVRVEGNSVYAEAGAHLAKIASAARDQDLTGLEFAAGIPGSLGGAAAMNAGAYGGEMKDVIREVRVVDENLKIREVAAADLDLSYRHSRIAEEGWIVLDARLELSRGDRAEITQKMDELREARRAKQPLEYPSAGSTFKRPEGYFAGKLIMDAGLRGFRVGDAQISEKHCGFVINRGKATAEDVRRLIAQVQEIVWEKFQVRMEPEIRFLGF